MQSRSNLKPVPGTHIKVWRGCFWHHGIVAEDATVIQSTGLDNGRLQGKIEQTTLAEFLKGTSYVVVPHDGEMVSGETALIRARSRLGQSQYNLLLNNCEHFANWCCTGNARSVQVERAGLVAGGGLLVIVAGLAGVRRRFRTA